MKDILIVGSANIDYMIDSDRLPSLGETIRGLDYNREIGGKGLNQAIAAFKHNNNAYFCGCLGHDDESQHVIGLMKSLSMETKYLFRDSLNNTGVAMVIRTQNDNAIIVNEGANGSLTFEDVKSVIDDLKLSYVILQFEIPLKVIEDTLLYCHKKGIKTVLNTAPATNFDESLYEMIDTIILNQIETEFYTGIYPSHKNDSQTAGKYFIEKGVKNVIITLGSGGSFYMNDEIILKQESYPSNIVDTTGAGDAYVGVYISALNEYRSVEKALKYASAAGSITCEKKGASVSSPTRSEITSKLREEI